MADEGEQCETSELGNSYHKLHISVFDLCKVSTTAVQITFRVCICTYKDPPQGGSRSFQWSETGMEDLKRTPWQCTASVCVAGVYCLEISLGLADPGNVICLSCGMSIYPRIFLCVFIVYCHIVRILCLLLYSAIC